MLSNETFRAIFEKKLLNFVGLRIPSDRCGSFYILARLDGADNIDETWKYNNIAVTSVTVKCDKGTAFLP